MSVATVRRVVLAALLAAALVGRAGDAAAQPPAGLGAPLHDDRVLAMVLADRLEWQARDGEDGHLLDARGWVGRDRDKARFRLQTEAAGGTWRQAEAQLLYGRMVAPFWDLVGGVRYDARPHPSRAHAVAGLLGLAPYRFEVDAAAFLSDEGDLTARLEAEYALRFTQRLIARPRLELNAAARAVDDLGLAAGVNDLELGLRLGYELRREVAPYLGVSHTRVTGATAGRARAGGNDVTDTALVVGFRLWY